MTPQLPMHYAPLRDQVLATRSSPPPMRAPDVPEEPTASPVVRDLLLAAADEFERYQPAYSDEAPVEVFLAQSAATGAVFRLRAIAELLRDGVCGLVAATMARSLLDDAAAWSWVAGGPAREASMVDYLAAEWSGLNGRAATCGTPPPAIERWLAPPAWKGALSSAGAVTDPFPGSESAVDALSRPPPADPAADSAMPVRLPAIRTMASVLANCGHFNAYSALFCPFDWSPAGGLSSDAALGGRLAPELEAVVAHVAAAATLTICVVTAWSDPDPDPGAEDRLRQAAEAVFAIDSLAASVHGLGGVSETWPDRPAAAVRRRRRTSRAADPVEQSSSRWRPHPDDSIEEVRAAAVSFFDVATRQGPQLLPVPPVSRARFVVLPVLTSTMWAARTLAHDVNTTTVGAHAARQLLEAGAKWCWALDGDEDTVVERSNALLSEAARWRDKVAGDAERDGVADTVDWFRKPSGFDVDDLVSGLVPGRSPRLVDVWEVTAVPHAGLGGPWVELAYSLLSQSTHHTPIGALHAISAADAEPGLFSGQTSPQLEALAIDAGVVGACWLWTGLAPFMLGVPTSEGRTFDRLALVEWRDDMRACARRVHAAAFPFHGLLADADLKGARRNDTCPCRSGRKVKYCHGA